MKELKKSIIIEKLKEKINLLSLQPEHNWSGHIKSYDTNEAGSPEVKASIVNCSLDFDLWKGLRNPATAGVYPLSLEQIWEYYANIRKHNVDESGRSTIFQIPRSYDQAKREYKRVVIISVMLPIAAAAFKEYYKCIETGIEAPFEIFRKIYKENNNLLDKSLTRLGFDIMNKKRAVIVMTSDNVDKISAEVVARSRQGDSHGVCKGGNYPQKSIAALTGLAQFGISRLSIIDEIQNSQIKRFIGPVRSMIIFDTENLTTKSNNDILYLNEKLREKIFKVNDFTNVDPGITKYRYCTYNKHTDSTACAACVKGCPSGAVRASAPMPDGKYPERILKQDSRFYDGKLQFNNGNCSNYRGQMSDLYDEWMCGRCMVSCSVSGKRSTYAVQHYYNYLKGN